MNSGSYWKQRAQMVMEQGMESANKTAANLRAGYRRAQREVQAGIDNLYANFAKEGRMTYADAVEYLSSGEVKEWRFTLAEYVERINATGDEDLLRELNALSARSRIRRLQQVETAIRVAAAELASKGEALVQDLLTDVYRGTYRTIGNDIITALGLSGRLEMLNARTVAQAIAYPWSGASYSERIWHNAEQLSVALRQTVTQGLIQGQDVRQMAGSIRKVTGTAAQNAERLVRTEVARCVEDATLEGYLATGIDQYQIHVDADERTCDMCGGIDEAEPHDVADAVMGVNVPPFHPNCRCTTVPYFSAEQLVRWERLGAEDTDGG